MQFLKNARMRAVETEYNLKLEVKLQAAWGLRELVEGWALVVRSLWIEGNKELRANAKKLMHGAGRWPKAWRELGLGCEESID